MSSAFERHQHQSLTNQHNMTATETETETEIQNPAVVTDMVDTVESTDQVEINDVKAAPKIRRHGRSVERDSIVFPDGEWTIKEAHALNPEVCHATIYHHVKQMVALNLMTHCGTRKGNRGKPTFVYRKVDPITVTDIIVDASVDQPF